MSKRAPTYDELYELAKWVQTFQTKALEIWKKNGFVYRDEQGTGIPEPLWAKLAFTHYSDLCEIENRARQLFEDE